MKTNLLCKALMASLCLAASVEANAKDYYLAPGGTGNGMSIDKPFGDPIKAFGTFTVKCKLGYEITAQLTVQIQEKS